MRILVLGLNFYPESVGIGVYTHDMCRYFHEAGNEVEVITGFPFYPELKKHPRYVGRHFMTEMVDGIEVRRCLTHVPREWSTAGRIRHEMSFAISATIRLLTVRRPDILVVVSPAFAPAVMGGFTARMRGVPFAVHVQDLQPDAAIELGLIKNERLAKTLWRAERWLYRNATAVSVLDDTMRRRLLAKGVPADKVAVFPNWVDLTADVPRGDAMRFRARYQLGHRFLVVYSGSMGVKHGLEQILSVARLAESDPNVLFILIGDGAVRGALERQASRLALRNVKFLPLQPVDRFPDVLAATDVAFIPQRPEVSNLVVPSKLLRLLACGSPVVAAADEASGLARLVRDSGGGVVVPPASAHAAWSAIHQIKEDEARRLQMAQRGQRYVGQRFSRERVLGNYLTLLWQVVGRSAAVAETPKS